MQIFIVLLIMKEDNVFLLPLQTDGRTDRADRPTLFWKLHVILIRMLYNTPCLLV